MAILAKSRSTWLGCVAFCAFSLILGCRTPSPDWVGTWKLNPSRSNFQGPVFTISVSTDGEYRLDEGNSSYAFRCDGNFRPMGEGRTQACVRGSATTLDLTRKENGVKTKAYHWELSNDGKVYTSTVTAFRPEWTRGDSTIVASRMAGSDGFAGRWQDTSYLQQHAEMSLRLDNQVLHIGYPSAGLYVDTPLNGVDTAVHGPRTEEGTTYSARSVGRREIHTLTKRNGKVLTQGTLRLSNEGRIITESWWNPDRPEDKGTLIYEKQ